MGQLACIQNANKDVPSEAPAPLQDCKDIVHVAIFFDGTGNNRFEDEGSKSWSNVARLFFAARDEKALGIHRVYISGVGTRYNASRNWGERLDSWVEDNTLGNAAGLGGDRRLDGGGLQMSAALENALLQNARVEGGKHRQIAERMRGEGFAKMQEALGNHRLIKAINFSVFGFSRGAALARAFANRLANQMQPGSELGFLYQGIPAEISFLGIFDTVASFGLPGKNWAGDEPKDLTIPPQVKTCHHYVAAHEVRFSFPVDLIRDKRGYLGHTERVYPGVHSDVGGGYEPDKQGRKDTLARIPLRHMLDAGIEHGVRLHSLAYLQRNRGVIAQRLAVDKKTVDDYHAYKALAGNGGTVEDAIKRHMTLYYSYRGTQHRAKAGTNSANERRLTRLRRELSAARNLESQAESTKWKEFMWGSVGSWWNARKAEGTLEDRVDALGEQLEAAEKDAQRLLASDESIAIQAYALRRALETGDRLVAKDGALVLVLEKHQWMLDAWLSNANEDVIRFFDNYVHDSRTDFIGGKEPFVYFRLRGIHEQARRRAGATSDW